MKLIDWQMLSFVSVTILHDYWIYSKLPRIYFWDHRGNRKPPDEKINRSIA
ncbi:hypothetical protein [Evansella halocellulosilytica]|uniref:hypothetical protein n=1 Tax=Evansella halocellulosilytica TaxID=2011013 RepID=UPI0015CAAC83|nr:hypothetical protein [Evansella halocellulosilytica]